MPRVNYEEETLSPFLQFVEQYADTYTKFQLLFFLARHPHTHFDFPSIFSALEERDLELRRVLETMAERGLVEKSASYGTTLYRLAPPLEGKAPILELARLTWEQAQRLAEICAAQRLCQVAAAPVEVLCPQDS